MSAESRWSIENELIALCGGGSLANALVHMGFPSNSHVREIDGERWRRGGAETYIYRFSVVTGFDGRPLLAKACVPFLGASSVDEVLDEWLLRRHLLESCGLATPKLFASGNGIIVEEFIEFQLRDILSSSGLTEEILDALASYAAALDAHGFSSVDAFSDLRSRGRDVVPIDFGEDIGPARRVAPSLGCHEQKLRSWLNSIVADEHFPSESIWDKTLSTARQRLQGRATS